MRVRSIEIVEDRTAQSRCDEGFITVSRLVLPNVYADGSKSEPYPCDIASGPGYGDPANALAIEAHDLSVAKLIQAVIKGRHSP